MKQQKNGNAIWQYKMFPFIRVMHQFFLCKKCVVSFFFFWFKPPKDVNSALFTMIEYQHKYLTMAIHYHSRNLLVHYVKWWRKVHTRTHVNRKINKWCSIAHAQIIMNVIGNIYFIIGKQEIIHNLSKTFNSKTWIDFLKSFGLPTCGWIICCVVL